MRGSGGCSGSAVERRRRASGCERAVTVQCTRSPSRVHRTWVSHAKSLEESGAKLKYTTSGRPRSSESGTNPQYRLSSELSRLSPRTKYCDSGTTNGPQLFRDGWYATVAPAVFTRKLPCHRNSSHTGSASGSECDTYGSASARPFRMRIPSRIASVSPGSPTSRLTKFLVRSFGHSKTMTSPRLGLRSPGSRLFTTGSSAPYTTLFTSRKSPTSRVRSMLPLGILNASTRKVLMPTNITTEITMIFAQSHRNSRLPRARLTCCSASSFRSGVISRLIGGWIGSGDPDISTCSINPRLRGPASTPRTTARPTSSVGRAEVIVDLRPLQDTREVAVADLR